MSDQATNGTQEELALVHYWRGYKDAIMHADFAIKKHGDDRTVRGCRQAVLALIKVPYDPNHAIPKKPNWKSVPSENPVIGSEQEERPVAWRVKDFADGWILFHDEAAAHKECESTGQLMQGLYVRHG